MDWAKANARRDVKQFFGEFLGIGASYIRGFTVRLGDNDEYITSDDNGNLETDH